MTELKPCPFCGSSLDIFFEDSYKARLGCYCAELRCFRCGASIHGHGNTKEVSEDHARHRWNTRAERTCTNVYAGREFECSECGMQYHLLDREDEMEEWAHVRKPAFCPNCGAKVVE